MRLRIYQNTASGALACCSLAACKSQNRRGRLTFRTVSPCSPRRRGVSGVSGDCPSLTGTDSAVFQGRRASAARCTLQSALATSIKRVLRLEDGPGADSEIVTAALVSGGHEVGEVGLAPVVTPIWACRSPDG